MAPHRVTLSVRTVATLLGTGFTAYFFARGFWWVEQPEHPALLVGGLVLYLVALLAMMLTPDDAGARMPVAIAVFGVLAAAAVPAMASLAYPLHVRDAPSVTWYIGGMGLFGIVCVVRRRPAFGWAALAAFALSTMLWMEPGRAFHLGILGGVIWMIAASLLLWMWRRAVHDTERLAEIQQQVSAWHAAQQARRRERRGRARHALAVAGPVLSAVVTSEGRLTEQERLHARLAEGRLRDELRGGMLLDDTLREAIAAVRRAGGTVTLIDEGGMTDLGRVRQDEIRAEIAAVIRKGEAQRIIIRAAPHPTTAVTVVGRSGQGGPDEDDAVKLWVQIPRERSDAAEKRGGGGPI